MANTSKKLDESYSGNNNITRNVGTWPIIKIM